MQDYVKTKVIFRRWKKEPKTVIALFPEIPEHNFNCSCYEHVGQHGAASYAVVMYNTTPAKFEEPDVQSLFFELEQQIGYNLKIRQRYTKRY